MASRIRGRNRTREAAKASDSIEQVEPSFAQSELLHHPHHHVASLTLDDYKKSLLYRRIHETYLYLHYHGIASRSLRSSQTHPLTPRATHVVKLDSQDTPPPLHFSPAVSDRERSSTRETTPISTPRGFATGYSRRPEKESLVSWHHKHGGFHHNSYADSTLLESDFEDSTFPLFNEASATIDMESPTMPLNIATAARHESTRAAQPSASSSALQDTSGNEMRSTSAMDLGSGSMKFTPTFGGLQNTSGAQPISMNSSNRERPRRESLAGSMVSGMSWGGNSVGSWIRDEYAF